MDDIFFPRFTDVKSKEKCVRNNYNILMIMLKNWITWQLNHCFKGTNHSFFIYFSLNLSSLPMKLVHDIFSLGLIHMKTKEKCFIDICNVLQIILKNCITRPLKNCFQSPNHSFFIIFCLIWARCQWKCCTTYLLLNSLTWN